MDGFINSKIEKQTIYEIYRACRLCGAGAGYKMPIIQNVVNLDGGEVELKQKIRECVQIEVHQDDKMPPLICELCVDKVNDFYEFLEMCRHTNKRTRLRLGLPPQTMPRGAPDAGDCILGVTEPVFLNEDSSEPSLRSRSKNNKSVKNKKEIISNNSSVRNNSREGRSESRLLRSRPPSPPRLRAARRCPEDELSLSKLQKSRKPDPMPKSILKKQIKKEDDSLALLAPRARRLRDKELPVRTEVQNKKVQLVVSPAPRSKSPAPPLRCAACRARFSSPRALSNHARTHAHKETEKKSSRKEIFKCTDCGKIFPRKTLLNVHKCPKQGGDCVECGKHFYSQKSLIRHRSTCAKKREAVISPSIRRMLRSFEVRVARCDPLLGNLSGERYDVSNVDHDYGLDKSRIYPYKLSSRSIKFEPGCMVDIDDDIRRAFDADQYVHWDSEDSASDAGDAGPVGSLAHLALKTIFSRRCLGKVPRKRRKVKAETAFDSILNVSDFDADLKMGIGDIIDSLDKDGGDEGDGRDREDNDSLFGDDGKAETVTNDDFDSLFDKNASNGNGIKEPADLNESSNLNTDEDAGSKRDSEAVDNVNVNVNENGEVDESNETVTGDIANSLEEGDVNSLSVTQVYNNESSCDKISLSDNNVSVNVNNVTKTENGANIVCKDINGTDDKFSMDDLEDLSDTEVDDTRLMQDLDDQIGEGLNGKPASDRVDIQSDEQSTLKVESISDDFNLNV